MQRFAAMLLVLSFLGLLAVPPAYAEFGKAGTSAVNTVINTAFGWVECPKAFWDEGKKAASRGYVGVVVTAPTMCAANVAVRYVGNAVDWIKMPVSWLDGFEGNVVVPAIYKKIEPVIPLPLK